MDTLNLTELENAAALLGKGELVAFPTETVYGLGADARNPDAVKKIFLAKGRPADHPLIVHLPSVAALDHWARDIPDAARVLAVAFWPGPLTLVLKRAKGVSDLITGGQDTVALRMPNHPMALGLLRAFAVTSASPFCGLAAPSANRFGHISPTTAQHVREELGASVAKILDGGPCRVGIESTILDLSSGAPRILRPGMVGADLIAAILGCKILGDPRESDRATVPRVSGSLDAHYAPRTPLKLVAAADMSTAVAGALAAGRRLAVMSFVKPPETSLLAWAAASASPRDYAQSLYANLRTLDAAGADLMLVEMPGPLSASPAADDWQAIRDRLKRAAAGSTLA